MEKLTAMSVQKAIGKAATAGPAQRKAMLRRATEELVGVTFFGQMLKIARQSKLKGTFGHGGHGEEVFGSQLDQHLAQELGHAVKNDLSESIYKRFAAKV